MSARRTVGLAGLIADEESAAMHVGLWKRIALASFVALAGALPQLVAEDEVTEAEVQQKYMGAFASELKLKERVDIFISVATDYEESVWADDALWVLAQIASRTGYREEAVRFREMALARKDPPCLEAFTKRTWVYRNSRIPNVVWVLDRTGHRYEREEEKEKALKVVPGQDKDGKPLVLVRAVPFDPLPMVLNEELALMYERDGKARQALHRYREALKCAPEEGFFADVYRQRIERLEREVEREKALQPDEQTGAKEPGPEGKNADSRESKAGAGHQDRQHTAGEPSEESEKPPQGAEEGEKETETPQAD